MIEDSAPDSQFLQASTLARRPAAEPTGAEARIGADAVVDAFLRHETSHVFIFPGGTIAPILDRIEKRTAIEIVCPRNEQGAGYAAIAHAALTGKPAVYMVTSGPGVTNAVTPVADAYFDNIPLIVLTGQVGTSDMRRSLPVRQRGFQEVDTIGLMKPIAKAAFLVKDVRELPDIMERAFFLAGSGRKGPVVVDLPMDVQRAGLPERAFARVRGRVARNPRLPAKQIAQLADWIVRAKRPVILAGGGAVSARAEGAIRAIAERHGIPVTMSLPAVGVYPASKPLSLGLCGYAGSQYANKAIHNADLLLGIGTTFHVRQTGTLPRETAPGAKIARIDIDRGELASSRVPLNLSIEADSGAALAALDGMLEAHGDTRANTRAWLSTIADWKARYPLSTGEGGPLKPQSVIAAVDRITKGERVIVTTGVGQHQIWVARHFRFANPDRRLLTSSGHGTMGYDLPAAIGTKIAAPGAMAICFAGDGSFQMNIQELATIAERNLAIKIVVLDNCALNIVAQFQRQNWKSHPATGDRFNPDFARIAKAYGIPAVSIRSPQKLETTLAAALRREGPVLIHCAVDAREDLLPMLLGGHRLDDMSFRSSFD